MLGFLNIYKPGGLTSHDVVSRVRRLTGIRRVGHAGTLDPMAEGVLPIALGQACRLIRFLPTGKTYLAEILLGKRTDTDDIEGTTLQEHTGALPSLNALAQQLLAFSGSVEQRPPLYSALKYKGERLYDIARRGGETPPVKVRQVQLFQTDLLSYTPPTMKLRIACSAGTYIRSIARDLGEKLGVGGCLAALIREESCALRSADSITIEQLAEHKAAGTLASLVVPPEELLRQAGLVCLHIDASEQQRLTFGQRIACCERSLGPEQNRLYLVSGASSFLAICSRIENQLKPEVVIDSAEVQAVR